MRHIVGWLALSVLGCGASRVPDARPPDARFILAGPSGDLEVRVLGRPHPIYPTIILPAQLDSADALVDCALAGRRPHTINAVVVSLRGRGRSSAPGRGGYAPERQAEDVAAVLTAVGGTQARLIAFGRSVTVALAFARRWPTRFWRLDAIDGGARWFQGPGWPPPGPVGAALTHDVAHWPGPFMPTGRGSFYAADLGPVARSAAQSIRAFVPTGAAHDHGWGALGVDVRRVEAVLDSAFFVGLGLDAEARARSTLDYEVRPDGHAFGCRASPTAR